MLKLTKSLLLVVKELIELEATQRELERAFPYLDGRYYYARKKQVEERMADLRVILRKASLNLPDDAPVEQYLITEG